MYIYFSRMAGLGSFEFNVLYGDCFALSLSVSLWETEMIGSQCTKVCVN